MFNYILIFAVAFSVTYLITPGIRYIALKLSILDRKDPRKEQHKVITRFGGLAIYLGFVFAFLSSFLTNSSAVNGSVMALVKVIMAGSLVMCLGIYDDIKGADAKIKFFFQVIASILFIESGFLVEKITNPFGGSFELGVFSVPVTVLWLVGITNAINLIDGLDGLAAGIVFISSLGLAASFLFSGDSTLPVIAALSLAGATLAFLQYNFHPAKIYMGDTGSMFLGFTIAAIAIMSSHKTSVSISLLIPILSLGIPIIDTTLAFSRRVLNGKSPFHADNSHIHHWLKRRNTNTAQVVLILLGVTFLLNVIAIATLLFRR